MRFHHAVTTTLRTGLAAVAAALAPPALGDITTGLNGHWTFDGHTQDQSAGSHHGLTQGGVGYTPGPRGLAASFDGVNDFVRINHAGALTPDLDTQAFSVTCWARIEPGTDSQWHLFQDRFAQDTVAFSLYADPAADGSIIRTSSWYKLPNVDPDYIRVTVSPLQPYLGAWHHFAIVYRPDVGLTLYIDGVAQGPPAPRLVDHDFIPNTQGVLTVGAAWQPPHSSIDNFFKGAIDDLRTYSRALTSADIAELISPHCAATGALAEGFESGSLGATPNAWSTTGDAALSAAHAASGARSVRLAAIPAAAGGLLSGWSGKTAHGVATLDFAMRFSAESTTALSPGACADFRVRYTGAAGAFGLGFSASPAGQMVIAGTSLAVTPDRWYRFHGVADFKSRLVRWTIDDGLLSLCTHLDPGVGDPARRDRIEIQAGCIDNGQSVIYVDSIYFTRGDACGGDHDRDHSLTILDIFSFLNAWFAGCP